MDTILLDLPEDNDDEEMVVNVEPDFKLETLNCEYCLQTFTTIEHLEDHTRLCSERVFKCVHCHQEFNYNSTYIRHLQYYCSAKHYNCDHCRKKFCFRSSLRSHSHFHCDLKKHVCHRCQQRFLNAGALKHHLRRHKRFHCRRCGHDFQFKKDAEHHRRVLGHRCHYWCKRCNRIFHKRSTLRKHVKLHAAKTKVKNSVGKHFLLVEALRRQCNIDESHFCSTCNKSFQSSFIFNNHIKYHRSGLSLDKDKPWVCIICFKCFKSRRYLARHEKLHSKTETFSCEVCDKVYSRAMSLKLHIQRCHSDTDTFSTADYKFRCLICQKFFKLNSELQRHNESIHGEKCSVGNVMSKSGAKHFIGKRAKGKQHEISKSIFKKADKSDSESEKECVPNYAASDSESDQEWLPQKSGNSVSSSKKKKRAVKKRVASKCRNFKEKRQISPVKVELSERHGKESKNSDEWLESGDESLEDNAPMSGESILCDVCGADFTTNFDLDQHVKVCKKQSPYDCEVCEKTFNSLDSLRKHKHTHDQNNPHACIDCSKRFRAASELTRHQMMAHSNPTPTHTCSECGKKFHLADQLRRHTNKCHSDLILDIICEVCNKVFKTKDNLRKHRMTHQVKPFACSECDKTFRCESDLKKHQLVNHSNNEPAFSCKICNKKFMLPELLRKHMIRVHGIYDRGFTVDGAKSGEDVEETITNKFKPTMCMKESTSDESVRQEDEEEISAFKDVGTDENLSRSEALNRENDADKPWMEPVVKVCIKQEVIKNSEIDLEESCCEVKRLDADNKEMKSPENIENKDSVNISMSEPNIAQNELLKCSAKERQDDAGDPSSPSNQFSQLPSDGAIGDTSEAKFEDLNDRFECKFCKKRFTNLKILKCHILAHNEDLRFTCDICGELFKDADTLDKHAFIHAGSKLFSCSECKEVFHTQTDQDEHLLVHTLQEPLLSPERGQQFQLLESQKLHLVECDDVRLFTCDLCSKHFKNQNSLKKHKLIHAVKKSFTCSFCAQSFCSQYEMEKHMSYHSNDDELCTNEEGLFTDRKSDANFQESQASAEFATGKLDSINDVHHPQSHKVGKRSVIKKESNKNDQLECKYCRKCFTSWETLKHHIHCHDGERPFTCDICGKQLKDKQSMKKHAFTHGEPKPFSCSECGKGFRCQSDLDKHSLVHKPHEAQLCTECGKQFILPEALKRHMRRHNDHRPFACSVCSKRFKDNNSLKKHELTHAFQKPFPCTLCLKSFRCQSELDQHLIGHDNKRDFACPVCPKTFNLQAMLSHHMKIHFEGKPHSCHLCGKQFRLKTSLEKHLASQTCLKPVVRRQRKPRSKQIRLLSVVPDENGKFPCDQCHKQFLTKRYLRQHLNNVHCERQTLCCEYCGKQLRSKPSLQRHLQFCHSEGQPDESLKLAESTEKQLCLVCGKLYRNLTRHKKIHEDRVCYTCPICSKTLLSKESLTMHLKIHQGLKFYCETCGKSFATSTYLSQHKRHVHLSDKLYSCPVCSKQCKLKRSLKYHMYIHEKQKPFECKVCSAKFGFRSSLLRHQLTHSDAKPFKCEVCGDRFRFKNVLKVHFRTHKMADATHEMQMPDMTHFIGYQANPQQQMDTGINMQSMTISQPINQLTLQQPATIPVQMSHTVYQLLTL